MTKEQLMQRKITLTNELEEVNNQLTNFSNELTFDEWKRFNLKNDYTYLTYLSDDMRTLFDNLMSWDRYETVTLYELLENLSEHINEPGEYDELPFPVEQCYNIIQQSNFGSVTCDW